MTVEEAFETLGLAPDADAKAIKRAYHKQLRRTKPERDPEGFKRLREAFEAATAHAAMEAFRNRDAPAESEPPAAASLPEVDPAVVWSALERGELQWAHALVMDERWANAMLDQPHGPLEWTTREVGLRVILIHRPAFDVLAAKYPTVFPNHDQRLAYLLRVSAEWSRLAAREPLPVELAAFISSLGGDEAHHRRTAHALGMWFHRDVAANLEVLRSILIRSPDFASVLEGSARAFSAELDASSSLDPVPPRRALRPLTRAVTLGSIAVALTVLIPTGGDLSAALVLRVLKAAALFGFVHYAEEQAYLAFPVLRRRFLAACIDAGLEPHLAASQLRGHPLLRKAILDDDVITVAFHVGRLARLEVER